jgi:PKD repeat protein
MCDPAKIRLSCAVVYILLALLMIVPVAIAGNTATITITGQVVKLSSPVANFTANKTTGYAPLSVQFTDLSTGNPTSWKWDFETDGTVDDTIPNPFHTYMRHGVYNVTLTVQNVEGSDAEVKLAYITVKERDAGVRIEALEQYIQGLPVSNWAKWYLTNPLDNALKQLKKGKGPLAVNQMKVFIKQVELLHRFRILTAKQAGYMVSEAKMIIDLIQV